MTRRSVERSRFAALQVRGGGIPSGTAYVDVHTMKNPKGEIRGQISRLGP